MPNRKAEGAIIVEGQAMDLAELGHGLRLVSMFTPIIEGLGFNQDLKPLTHSVL